MFRKYEESEVTILSAIALQNTVTSDGPVGPFVRTQLLARLREALHIATGDLSSNLERFRDLLTEVAERADALNLVRTARADRASPQPSSVLAVATLSKTNGEPVGEFLLIPFGEVVVERPIAGENFVFTAAHAESAKQWFDQMGRKLAIDYEHQSLDRLNTRADGLRPAAGWIGALEVRDDGLWAVNVSWTDRAQELLRSGEYRYFSPVIFWTDEDHTDVAALGPVALTNDPAMHGVSALAAGRQNAEGGPAETQTHTSPHDTPVAETDDVAQQEVLVAARAKLEAAEAEINLLRHELEAQEADTFVERGLRLGKILESTAADWRADYLRDAVATEQRLARAPILLPPGRMIALDRRGNAADRPRRPQTAANEHTVSEWGIEADDLAAYERAAAAGRVLHTGAQPVGRAVRGF